MVCTCKLCGFGADLEERAWASGIGSRAGDEIIISPRNVNKIAYIL